MEFSALTARALDVRRLYEVHEQRRYGRQWSLEELMLGLVGDVGDLAKRVQALEGVRLIDDPDERIEHELADLLWAIIVIAEKCGVDLETSFFQTMAELESSLHIPNERKNVERSDP
jgi:NTP pyrophosphatase (non-canonical NTP hydrolase)